MRTHGLARFGIAAVLAGFVALAWGSGCGGSDGKGTDPPPGQPGISNACGADLTSDLRNCGACGHSCEANHYCKAGSCEPGCPAGVLYVSNAGDDHNYGCAQTAPRKTIGATLGLARALGMKNHEIHVCAGTFRENGLAIDHPVSLRGGYDCTTWTRTEGYGMAGGFDGVNQTILEHVEAGGATLGIRGASVGPQVRVDGLTIRGGQFAQGGGAVLLSSGAAPVLANNVIAGGSAVSTGDLIGSYGIYVQSGASPEITESAIAGGSGTGQGSFGSVGIAMASDAGQPRIHGNRIDGGSGTTTLGVASTGLLFAGKAPLTGDRAVRNNVIRGGTGRALGASGTGSIGVIVNDAAAIELSKNVIEGGSSTCAGACPVRGVSVTRTQGARIVQNRIYGGDATPASATAWGVLVAESGDAVLENNMVHGGGKAGTLNTVFAVEVSQSTAVAVRGNTLFTSPSAAGGQSQALGITRQSSSVTVENDLLIGSRSPRDVGLLLFACPAGGALTTFRNNAFANFGDTLAFSVTTTNVACDTRGSFTTIAALEQFATNTAGAPAARVSGSVQSGAALSAIFSAWTDVESGYPELVKAGWTLLPKAPCAIARGGFDLRDTLAADAFGKARTAPLTIGAEELTDDSACTP
ncbi:right-handed parallel beta-helix repeat-containing protein [Pendulispora albinea]|uniref:Right-handed parallel beta-helix repeat-containing protein n=1 Tax=Pendulispora albinea TaxID=2741071 RepID=A0ABZ2LQ94_9BACT